MAFVLAGFLSNRQRWWDLCWRSFKWPASTNGSVLAGRPPASTKGHFYCLKVAGGCRAHQQNPVLAVRTNCFWPSAYKQQLNSSRVSPHLYTLSPFLSAYSLLYFHPDSWIEGINQIIANGGARAEGWRQNAVGSKVQCRTPLAC
jgi:hypothetical protein